MEGSKILADGPVQAIVEGKTGTINLASSDGLNALDTDTTQAFFNAVSALLEIPDLGVVVLKSAGDTFSVGGSLRAFHDAGDGVSQLLDGMTKSFHGGIAALMRHRAPVISVVRGMAAGGGASLACAGDLIVAADSARFNFAYTAVGLSPDGSCTYTLPRKVGSAKAYEILVTNPTLTAEQARELGIINFVFEKEELDKEVSKLANKLAHGPTESYGVVKHLLLNSLTQSPEQQMSEEARSIALLAQSRDGKEGMKAFLEKRHPEFSGE